MVQIYKHRVHSRTKANLFPVFLFKTCYLCIALKSTRQLLYENIFISPLYLLLFSRVGSKKSHYQWLPHRCQKR